MTRPLTEEQALHARRYAGEMASVLFRLKTHLEKCGHTDDHTYYNIVVQTWQAVIELNRASLFVSGHCGFWVPDGSLTTGPIPPPR